MATEMRFRQQFVFSLQMFSTHNHLQVPGLDKLSCVQVFGNCWSTYRTAMQSRGVRDASSPLATQLRGWNLGDVTLVGNLVYWDDGSINKVCMSRSPAPCRS